MVKNVNKSGKSHFMCDECGFAYEIRELAQKCEDWCKAHHSCSLEITRHAVNLKQ